jgi:hypothetical protein
LWQIKIKARAGKRNAKAAAEARMDVPAVTLADLKTLRNLLPAQAATEDATLISQDERYPVRWLACA